MEILYTKGDATRPELSGNKIIAHICNDIGGWGKGFVMAVSKRWPLPEKEYRTWYKSGKGFGLGKIQCVQVEEDTWVANMIGQHKINKDENGLSPIRYDAVAECLGYLAAYAQEISASVHMPRIGCGLAGGTWDRIEPIIINNITNNGILVTVYDF